MVSLSPNSPPADTSAAYTLLAIIADPTAAKQRLDDLVAEKLRSIEAMENAKLAQAAAEDKLVAAGAMTAQSEKASDAVAARSKQLDGERKSLTEKASELAELDRSIKARQFQIEADLKPREDNVSVRETAVAAREIAAQSMLDDAQALKVEYETRLAAIKAAVA